MTKVNVIYASEMGTAMGVADDVVELASNKGIETTLSEMNDISIDELETLSTAMFITSSTGDGDLPMMGEDFWAALENADINLQNLKYSVCALGDRNYFSFCGAGKKIDGRLKELGAVSVVDRHECDGGVDGWDTWAENVFKQFGF
tara:strand:- start:745 stop:1182 length:438 start_codon:yes stop_codon:yes gene_type:complete